MACHPAVDPALASVAVFQALTRRALPLLRLGALLPPPPPSAPPSAAPSSQSSSSGPGQRLARLQRCSCFLVASRLCPAGSCEPWGQVLSSPHLCTGLALTSLRRYCGQKSKGMKGPWQGPSTSLDHPCTCVWVSGQALVTFLCPQPHHPTNPRPMRNLLPLHHHLPPPQRARV